MSDPGPTEPTEPIDLRLLPAAAAAWAVCWLVTAGLWWALVPAAVVVVATLVGALRGLRAAWALLAGVVVLISVLAGVRVGALHHSRPAELARDRSVVTVEVEITGDPRIVGTRRDLMIVPARVEVTDGRGMRTRGATPVMLTSTVAPGEATRSDPGAATGGTDTGGTGTGGAGPSGPGRAEAGVPWTRETVLVGARWRITGRLGPPDAGDAMAGWLRVADATPLSPPGAGWAWVERVRAGLRVAVAERSPPQRALVPALVVGDVSAMTPELEADFRTTGLTHLTAVSGANLTLLLGFVMVIARWAGVRGRWLTVVGVLTVAVFVALCRTEPSVIRATAMGLVALAAVGQGSRGRRGLRQLAVAVLALLIVDPWLARSVGFALSVLATAGIIVWAGAWADRMVWAPRVVAEAVCVPLAAQVATQTVVVGLSGQVSVVGLLSNALAGPLVGPATLAGFTAAGLSLIHPLPASWAGWVAAIAAQGITTIAELTARLPGAATTWPAGPVGLVLMAAACLVLAWWIPRVLGRRTACAAAVALLVFALSRPPLQPGWPPAGWVLVMCDVGQGDAAVVRLSEGVAVVVDTGPEPAALDRCLDQLAVRHVALAVLTHAHADHVGGAAALWDDGRSVAVVVDSPASAPDPTTDGIDAAVVSRGGTVRPTLAGDVITVGTVRWETVWPTPAAAQRLRATAGRPTAGRPTDGAGQESSAENDASVVGRLSVGEGGAGGLTVLFTGDIEPDGQRRVLATGADLRADVIKVPHHGSSRQEPRFIAATGARWAITSSGVDNSYGHPAARTVALLESSGMTVLRTDQQGGVALALDHGAWRVVTQR